eukprot:5311530-Prorocentrum_lima.AAC.1
MTSSLVGSEMCIRDRAMLADSMVFFGDVFKEIFGQTAVREAPRVTLRPVSYTHLTLPTICSV